MERADEYSATLRTDHFNRGAAALAIAAVLMGLFGANFPQPEWVGNIGAHYWWGGGLAVCLLAVGIGFWPWLRRKMGR